MVSVDNGYKVFMKLHIRNVTKKDFMDYKWECKVLQNYLSFALDVWLRIHLDTQMVQLHYMVGKRAFLKKTFLKVIAEVAAPTKATTTTTTVILIREEESTTEMKRQRQKGE